LPKLVYTYFSPTGLMVSKNLSNSSRLVIVEAEKHGVDWRIIPGTHIVTLTYKGQERSYYYQLPSSTTALAKYACNNKKITSNLLKQAGITVPKGFRVRRETDNDFLISVFNFLKKPLVIKPGNGSWGDNISVNISTKKKYLEAIDHAFSHSNKKNSGVIIEEMFAGNEYRILLSQEKVIGILNRIPANVVGDGISTIKKLITEKNKEDIRGAKGGVKSHLKIRVDKKLLDYLNEQKLDLSSIPKKGKQIFLRKVSNVSQGGEAIDCTDIAHPSVIKIALKAIRTIPGLSFAGIDFMTKDISKKQTKDSYVIIEINDTPGFDIHDYPYKGKNRHAAREFLYLIFPELRPSVK